MMSARWTHIAAALAALLALTSNWLISELYLYPDRAPHALLALAINAVLVLAPYVILSRLGREPWALLLLRVFSYAVFLSVLLEQTPTPRLLLVAALGVAVIVAIKASEATSLRLLGATAVAGLAFVAVPFVWVTISASHYDWLAPERAEQNQSRRGAVVVLLLDELSYEAAAPLASDLASGGLDVTYQPLASTGQNTQNVIPALFTGKDFSNARPCGPTAQCSGSNNLEYSRIHAGRDDIDVVGFPIPYCSIKGLRSCYRTPMSHEFGNAYAGLLSLYLRQVGLRLPAPEPTAGRRAFLRTEVSKLDEAPLWNDGGVLYAHLSIPHPPGLDRKGTLDGDYSANLEEARHIVRNLTRRLESRFGGNFTVIVFSDHALRPYWRTAGVYEPAKSQLRPAFRDTRVPLIIATPSTHNPATISSNIDIFRVVRAEVSRVLYTPVSR